MKMIKPIISIIVCVVLTLCVLVPVTNNMINDTLTEKYYNDVGSPAVVYSPDDNPNINVTYDMTTHTITGIETGSSPTNYMVSDNFSIRFGLNTTKFVFTYYDEQGDNYANHLNYSSATEISSVTMTINSNGITINLVGESTTTYNYDYTYISITNPNGNYRFMSVGDDAVTFYINDVNDIKMYNYIESGGHIASVTEGVATFDGVASTLIYDPTSVSGVDGVSTVVISGDSPTFGVEQNDIIYSKYMIVVPYIIEGHTHGNSTVIMMLSVLPILVVVSIIVGTGLLIRFNRT